MLRQAPTLICAIPDAYELFIAGLLGLYTVEAESVSIWRIRVDT
ncbi:hypothetical protein [Nonomuraea sp. NPDC050310]